MTEPACINCGCALGLSSLYCESCIRRDEPACINCGCALGLSSLYCESCIRRDAEPWYAWRDRLATVRRQLAPKETPEP